MATIHDDLRTAKATLDRLTGAGRHIADARSMLQGLDDTAVRSLDPVLARLSTLESTLRGEVRRITAIVTAPPPAPKPEPVAAKPATKPTVKAAPKLTKEQDRLARELCKLPAGVMDTMAKAAGITSNVKWDIAVQLAKLGVQLPAKATCGKPTKAGTPCKKPAPCKVHAYKPAPVAAKVETVPTLQATLQSQRIPADVSKLSESNARGLLRSLADTLPMEKVLALIDLAR